jgi:hypothetical protein
MLDKETDVEVKLPGRYKVSPQIASAIKPCRALSRWSWSRTRANRARGEPNRHVLNAGSDLQLAREPRHHLNSTTFRRVFIDATSQTAIGIAFRPPVYTVVGAAGQRLTAG